MFSIIRLNPFLTVLGGFSGSFHNIFVIGFLKICRKCQVITWFRNLFINFFVRKPIGRTGFKIVRRFLEKIGGWILKFFDQFGRRKLFLQTWSWKLSSKRWKFSIRSGFRDRRNRVLHILQYIFNSHFSCYFFLIEISKFLYLYDSNLSSHIWRYKNDPGANFKGLLFLFRKMQDSGHVLIDLSWSHSQNAHLRNTRNLILTKS